MKILFQSEDVVVVHKPAGWLSVPSIQGKSDPRKVVGLKLREQFGSVYPVHRLDFEVEGILLFALHSKAQVKLHKIWEGKEIRKIYHAKTGLQDVSHWPQNVEGVLTGPIELGASGTWESLIVQGKRRSFVAPHGQSSVTEFELLEQTQKGCVWRLSPVTGRRHQLRLELSRRGFPIWGDKLYGSSIDIGANRIALAATEISFNKDFNLQLPKNIKIEWDKGI